MSKQAKELGEYPNTVASLNKNLGQMAYPMKPEILLQRMRQAKGGVVGVGTKAPIALRFDDGQNAFKTTVYPLLIARGMPASMALVSEFNLQSWGNAATWADIVTWNRNGIEIWCHGKDHLDYEGSAGLVANIVTAKETIEANNIKVQGWALPGVTPVTNEHPYNDLTSTDDYFSEVGRMLYENYALTEAYCIGQYRPVPCGNFHGLDHITISDDISLAVATGHVDTAIQKGIGIEFMIHPANLGQPTRMTVADFTTFLDYLKTKWDAGLIEMVTPSGLMFADKSTNRIELVSNGGFEDAVTPVWTLAAGRTIEVSGGHTGNNFMRIASDHTLLSNQRPTSLQTLGFGGEAFMFEGWFRSNGAANTTARVMIVDYDDNTRLSLDKSKVSDGSNWTRIRVPFCLHPLTNKISIALGRAAQDGIDWDDVSVKKI